MAVDITRPADWKKRKKQLVNKQIKHQVMLRGQYTRVAKQAVKYLSDMKAAVKELMEEEIQNKNWKSSNKLKRTLDNIDRQIKDQYAAMGLDLTENLVELGEYEAEFAGEMYGAPFSSEDIDQMSIYSLVTDDPFDGKLLGEWLTEQELSTQTRVKQTIRLGIVNGLSNQQIMSAMFSDENNPFVGSKRSAETLVRTAAAHVTARADMAAFENGGIEKYQISSVLDNRTTKICAALDGKIYRVDDEKRKVPPFHPNCRSTMIAVFDDGPEVDQTFEQWLADQDEADQIKVLGAERHKMWKSGLPVDRFVDLDTLNVIPLSELKKQEKG